LGYKKEKEATAGRTSRLKIEYIKDKSLQLLNRLENESVAKAS
jgi:hypothetical protein